MNKRMIIIIAAVLVLAAAGIAIAVSGTFDTAERQIRLAYKLLDEGKYDEAILAFEKIIEIEPRSTRAYAGLGLAHAYKGNYEKAFTTVTGALAMDLDKPELLHESMVNIYLIKDDINGAKAHISSIIEHHILQYLEKVFPDLFKDTGETDQSLNEPHQLEKQVVKFEDKEFERMVRQLIQKQDEEIYNTDLLDVRKIFIVGVHVVNNNSDYRTFHSTSTGEIAGYTIDGTKYLERGKVSTLNDIELFPNIESLYIDFQEINDLSPVSELRNLNRLSLVGNQIKDISPLIKLQNLTILLLGCNRISNIKVLSELQNLKYLFLHANQISDISALGELTNLTGLNLTVNPIKDISALDRLKNLDYLLLGNNEITDISAVANLTNLTHLALAPNQISDYSPALNLPNLNEISKSHIESLANR